MFDLKNIYKTWHMNPKHKHMHWAIFLSLSIFVSAFLTYQINLTYPATMAKASAPALLSTSDLSCAGMFLTPGINTGGFTANYPITMRYESDGKRHYFQYSGDGHVLEFPEPA